MYLTSSTGLILYSSEHQEKKKKKKSFEPVSFGNREKRKTWNQNSWLEKALIQQGN